MSEVSNTLSKRVIPPMRAIPLAGTAAAFLPCYGHDLQVLSHRDLEEGAPHPDDRVTCQTGIDETFDGTQDNR